MEIRTSDFDPNVAEYVAGEFTEDSRYSTYREKGSRSYLLIYTRAGGGTVESGGERQDVAPGDLTLLAPRQMHAYGTDLKVGRWELQWIHFHPRPDWEPLLRWGGAGSRLSVIQLPVDLAERVSKNLTECVTLDPSRALNRRLVFNRLEEILVRAALLSGGQGVLDPRIQRVQEQVRREYSFAWDLSEMAAAAGLSTSRFGHLFREETGESPRSFVESVRLEHARRLLVEGKLPISAVSRTVGFTDEFYFANRFRKLTGLSPRAYRQSFDG